MAPENQVVTMCHSTFNGHLNRVQIVVQTNKAGSMFHTQRPAAANCHFDLYDFCPWHNTLRDAR